MVNDATPKGVLLPLGVAAAISGINYKRLTRMADRGQVTVTKTAGGHRRYLEDEIRALAAGGA